MGAVGGLLPGRELAAGEPAGGAVVATAPERSPHPGTEAARATALTPAQRASMRAACAPDNHRVRRPLLVLDLKAAIRASDWATAANLLNAFNAPDVAARVRALTRA